NLFSILYKQIGAVLPAYKLLRSDKVVRSSQVPAYDIDAGICAVIDCLVKGYDIAAQLKHHSDRLRAEILAGRLDSDDADASLRVLVGEGDRWFAGKGENFVERAMAYYEDLGRAAADPELKNEAYTRAVAYFERLIKRDRIGDPRGIDRLMPRMTIAVLDENGAFHDKPVGDLLANISEVFAASPVAAQTARKMEGYYLYEAALRAGMKEVIALDRWWEESEGEGGKMRTSQWILFSAMLLGWSLCAAQPVFALEGTGDVSPFVSFAGIYFAPLLGVVALSALPTGKRLKGVAVQQPAGMALEARQRAAAQADRDAAFARVLEKLPAVAEETVGAIVQGSSSGDVRDREEIVLREEGAASCAFRTDVPKDSLEVIVLHAESFYKMIYDRDRGKNVPVLKDLGSAILLRNLMQNRGKQDARRFVWVSTTSEGERIRKLAGLPDGDLSITPRNFTGDMTRLQTDPDTAARFVAYVEAEINAVFKKGADAGKKFDITVITEDVYFEKIWRNDVRDFVFAILIGETAMPSTALVAALGEKIPDELKPCIDRESDHVIGIFPKPSLQSVDYLNELSRQSAELATNA
ncbi:MAG TPA: hypothetical protein P5287_07785, partial [bacterium]|nr:hypothetical protein [bacterium]